MLTILSAHSPQYSDSEHQNIALIVKFEEFAEEMPFNATPHDPMPYGVELFNRAVAGEFGPIADFVPPPVQPQPSVSGTQTL